MHYGSVAEILESVGRTHQRLYEQLDGLTPGQADYRLADGRWTIEEIAEHLANVQEGMGKVTSLLLRQAEAEGAAGPSDGRIAPPDMSVVIDRVDERFEAPENVVPQGGRSIDESIERLKKNYDRLLGMRPRIEASDLSRYTYPHQAFGPLNGYQWLALIDLHERRHIEQIQGIKSSPGYPS
jgi:hypothetical protein